MKTALAIIVVLQITNTLVDNMEFQPAIILSQKNGAIESQNVWISQLQCTNNQTQNYSKWENSGVPGTII